MHLGSTDSSIASVYLWEDSENTNVNTVVSISAITSSGDEGVGLNFHLVSASAHPVCSIHFLKFDLVFKYIYF